MTYDIVTQAERILRGIKTRTDNLNPDMPNIIGGMWQQFFHEDIADAVTNRQGHSILALYSDYESDETGAYDFTLGCEVDGPAEAALTGELVEKKIPAGRYARFALAGDQRDQIAQLWQQIWQLNLPRTFTGDYEEYLFAADGTPGSIYVYIAM